MRLPSGVANLGRRRRRLMGVRQRFNETSTTCSEWKGCSAVFAGTALRASWWGRACRGGRLRVLRVARANSVVPWIERILKSVPGLRALEASPFTLTNGLEATALPQLE